MWKEIIDREKKQPYFKEITKRVLDEYRNKTIYPPLDDIFNAFKLCEYDNVKVVIIGQDPYHNVNQAHGLAFSVKKGNPVPPSLKNIYKELHEDLGVPIPNHGELTSWAQQGVLLLNTILTVEAHKPLSHKLIGWDQFTDRIIQLLNDDPAPKVFVLWGNNAKQKRRFITNPNHLILSSSHPSPLSARYSFFGSRMFSKINQFLIKNQREPIDFTIT
ncbi:uracil-DNA glycosylase [Candidatus Xianfuyuplasma coldseepsis]|uniref:Uracil-DNA glycosylase n=1 Tax=Candidatus Xianfuyuplasma coldseepsis TaxID=2782163 RepID=A0A7L7KNQ7_9MOLU|nr:uracil-DNA glycosylase [Xianfuyuplasma coldseepsis]QMS84277.1 uracil-DNA glycosylase [Xianfuyuplasma coldseepsis]